MLITHPGGGSSFDYGDHWDDGDLIYTGRGQDGDQKLDGPNRFVAHNDRELLLFEAAGSKTLRYLGQARCHSWWNSLEPNKRGEYRRIFRFRLRFEGGAQPDLRAATKSTSPSPGPRDASSYTPRPFDPDRVPSERQARSSLDPDQQRQRAEQADSTHQEILRTLGLWLAESDWSSLEEIHGATDLLAQRPRNLGGGRVLFEVKGINPQTERSRVRSGLAQLLEYRLLLGSTEDLLCLVTDGPISERRLQLLDSLGIGHLTVEGEELRISGLGASRAIFDPVELSSGPERQGR